MQDCAGTDYSGEISAVEGIWEEFKDGVEGKVDENGGSDDYFVVEDHLMGEEIVALSSEGPKFAGLQSFDVADEHVRGILDHLFFLVEGGGS